MSAVYPNPGQVQGTDQTLPIATLKHRHIIQNTNYKCGPSSMSELYPKLR